MSRKKFLAPCLSTEPVRSKCLRNIDSSECNAFFSVYLQMGREWVWLDSEQDYPNDSELSNDCRSLFSSWDSSLDLDMGSWRETEEPGAEKLEESSPGRASSELLVGDGGSEESQEEAEQVSSQNLLHFLSEVMGAIISKWGESQARRECLPVHFSPILNTVD